MQSCPQCLAELRPDPAAAADAIDDTLALGGRLYRPDGVAAFATGPGCTLLRQTYRSSLLLAGEGELIEATVEGPGPEARPPLLVRDLDGSLLFTLDRYEPVDNALVVTGADGAPLATFLRWPLSAGSGLDVRDETSAPVARLRPHRDDAADFELAETGGGRLGTVSRTDVDLDGWTDDQWALRVAARRLPIQPLAAVALVLAAKVLLGRQAPVRARPERWTDAETGDERDPGWFWS